MGLKTRLGFIQIKGKGEGRGPGGRNGPKGGKACGILTE